MKSIMQKAALLLSTAALAIALPLGSAQAEEKVTIAVSIPAATHGWAGGLNYHAQEAEKRLEALYPNVDITLVTANSPADQASNIEDLISVQQIDALVVLPFEPERFHVQLMQTYGRVSGTQEKSVEVRGVKRADLTTVARPYWVTRIEPLQPGG